MSRHLTVVPGARQEFFREFSSGDHDPAYWLHPVHGSRALEAKALETVAQAFDGDPHGPRWALTVLALAVDGNVKAIAQHGDALEMLAAHFSKPAPKDDCNPHGMMRPDGVA